MSAKATRKQLSLLRSLATRKGRRETGMYLIEGARLCDEFLSAGLPCSYLLVDEGRADEPGVHRLAERFAETGAMVICAPAHEVGRVADTVTSQGLVAAAPWEELSPDSLRFGKRAVVVALDGVADPGNVGAIIRTAAWFGVSAVLLGEGCADALNPKTVRATMGGLFYLSICRQAPLAETLTALKAEGFRIVAAEPGSEAAWRSWAETPHTALVLGNEARGLTPGLRHLADRRVGIPRIGRGESLNVAVTAGILLSALAK